MLELGTVKLESKSKWFNQLFNCFSTIKSYTYMYVVQLRHNRSFIRITFFHPIGWNGKVTFYLADRSCNSHWANWTCFLKLGSFVSFSFDTLISSVYFSSSSSLSVFFSLHFLIKSSKKIPEVIKHFVFNCDNNNDKLYGSCYYLIFVQQIANGVSKQKTKIKTRERERAR